MSLVIYTDIAELITNEGVAKKKGVAITKKDLGIIENAALVLDSKKGIQWMGPNSNLPKVFSKKAKSNSLKGKILTPALADCHTHLVYAGSRHNEFALRLEGYSYAEIANQGGGIRASVKATREATESELFQTAVERLKIAQSLGVGLIEIKSGYGLSTESELKVLRVIQKLKKHFQSKVIIQSTFLGAHAFPPEAKTKAQRCGYVDEIVDKMLPEVAKKKLADACDVFFDEGYFNKEESERILRKAKSLGLKIKLHADELADTGGAALSAKLKALSADHLLKANEKGLSQMAKNEVVAVLLPTTAFYLGLPYADIKKIRIHKLCPALATDYNPGSSPILNMPFVMSLACAQMGMTMPEAFAAATFGGAKALGFEKEHGQLALNQRPKLAIFNVPSYEALISNIAHPALCDGVF